MNFEIGTFDVDPAVLDLLVGPVDGPARFDVTVEGHQRVPVPLTATQRRLMRLRRMPPWYWRRVAEHTRLRWASTTYYGVEWIDAGERSARDGVEALGFEVAEAARTSHR